MLTLIYERLSLLLSSHLSSISLPPLVNLSAPSSLLLLCLTPPLSPPRFLSLQRGGHMLQTCSVPSGWLPVILTPGEKGSAGCLTGGIPLLPSSSFSSRLLHTWARMVWKEKKLGEEKRGGRTGQRIQCEGTQAQEMEGKWYINNEIPDLCVC